MENEDRISLINLFNALKEYSPQLEAALREGDAEKLAALKKEILKISSSISKII